MGYSYQGGAKERDKTREMDTGFKKYVGKVSLTLKLMRDILFPKDAGNTCHPPSWKLILGYIVPKRCGKHLLLLACMRTRVHTYHHAHGCKHNTDNDILGNNA